MAVGVIEAAKEMDRSIPLDLSVIGFDNREFSSFHEPGLTTVDLPLTEMGRTAARVLINLINGEIGKKGTLNSSVN
jgi:LacI family transcriptional regulator